MPQVALCMVWRRSLRMYLTYPVAHTLVREDDRFCCADFRLYRYSEAPLRTHTPLICALKRCKEAFDHKGPCLCARIREGHRVQEGLWPLKGRASLPYREAALLPLKEALQEDREDLLYTRVCLALANLAMCIFCRQAAPPGSQSRLICLGALLRCMGQDRWSG
jgi:hypothetical protein